MSNVCLFVVYFKGSVSLKKLIKGVYPPFETERTRVGQSSNQSVVGLTSPREDTA